MKLVQTLKSVPEDPDHAHDMFSTLVRRRLDIDDAFKVLRNLSFTTNKTESYHIKKNIKHIATKRVDDMIDNRIQTALAAFQKRPVDSNPNNTRRSSYRNCRGCFSIEKMVSGKIRNPAGKDIYCFDCGKKDHPRDDLICKQPSFQSKKCRKERDEF